MNPGEGNNRASISDTDELRNFREKWKHELHSTQRTPRHADTEAESTAVKEGNSTLVQQQSHKPRYDCAHFLE